MLVRLLMATTWIMDYLRSKMYSSSFFVLRETPGSWVRQDPLEYPARE